MSAITSRICRRTSASTICACGKRSSGSRRWRSRYGIAGFCVYYYNFGGQRALDQAFEAIVADRTIAFPYCICWANENWTRHWDGGSREIIFEQQYDEDALLQVSSRCGAICRGSALHPSQWQAALSGVSADADPGSAGIRGTCPRRLPRGGP